MGAYDWWSLSAREDWSDVLWAAYLVRCYSLDRKYYSYWKGVQTVVRIYKN